MPSPLAPDTQIYYKWTIKHYNYDGSTELPVDYTGYSVATSTNEILHAFDRNINFYLNGIDDCSFSLYLDDPMAAAIIPTKSVIRAWRHIYQSDETTVIYEDDDAEPAFIGIVQSTIKDGDANTMQIKAFSPLWRLQSRFHVFNHYLVTDQETGDPYTGTGLIFKMINLLNEAFPATGDAYTGIESGLRGWVDEPHISPYFIAKGSNTWSLIFDDIMSRPAAADIIPFYNNDSSNVMMILNTDEKRGTDNSDTIFFNYHTGTNDNCENVTEELNVNPGEFANFLWVIGQGGANSGKVALAWDNSSGDYDSNSIGLYMKTIDKSEIKRLSALQPIADAELYQARLPKEAHNITLSPYGGLLYKYHFDVGDVIKLVANKGALQISDSQRIYQVGLQMSDNNVETATPLVSADFYGKISPEGTTIIDTAGSGTSENVLTANFAFTQ